MVNSLHEDGTVIEPTLNCMASLPSMTVLQLSIVAAGLSLPAGVPAAGVAGAAVSVPAWEGSVVPVLVAGALAVSSAAVAVGVPAAGAAGAAVSGAAGEGSGVPVLVAGALAVSAAAVSAGVAAGVVVSRSAAESLPQAASASAHAAANKGILVFIVANLLR